MFSVTNIQRKLKVMQLFLALANLTCKLGDPSLYIYSSSIIYLFSGDILLNIKMTIRAIFKQ